MADELLRHQEERGIHRIVMDSRANALDPPLMTALGALLEQLRERGAPPVVIASSHPTLFSPGWDLKRLVGGDRAQVGEVLGSFNRLILDVFSYPGPTAAAIDGHAVAGGCLLAISCDLRVMATGQPRLGLAELNLGVPIPANSLKMLRARTNPAALEELVFRGDGCSADKARELGLVDRVAAGDDVMVAAERELQKLASKPGSAYRATKRFLFGDVWRAMDAPSPAEDGVFLDCWFEAGTLERIAEVARGLSH